MADVLKTSKEELYESLLVRYGVPYLDEQGNYVAITLRNDISTDVLGGHWVFIKSQQGFTSYMKIKGTSDYDSAEMAKFIDNVVGEAKELGIETLPPEELQRMKDDWEKRYGKKDSNKHTD